MKNYFSWFLMAILGLALAIPVSSMGQSPDKPTGKVYSVGVVPQFDTITIRKIWYPLIKELTRKTGIQFKMRGSRTIPEFEKEFNAGLFDFAYMNPYHVLLAAESQGYIPLVRDHGKSLHGILVVRKDSSIKSVKDLEGKRVVFPAPNALGASLMIQAAFQDVFGIKVLPQFVETHSSVYLNVALGEAQAGGGVQKTLSQQPSELGDTLKVLYKTKDVVPHPFTAHPRVPESVRAKILSAFLQMRKTPHGKALLSNIPIEKLGQAKMEDYQSLKELKLERFYKGN